MNHPTGMLSDVNIQQEIQAGRLIISPSTPGSVQPASIELHLDNDFIGVPRHLHSEPIDPWNPGRGGERFIVPDGKYYELQRGEFLLASTLEKVGLPDDIAAQLTGKSSLARMGLAIHVTAGFIDPGFNGHITLELANLGSRPILLRPTMRIGQLALWYTATPAATPYGAPTLGSHYQDQDGAQAGKAI